VHAGDFDVQSRLDDLKRRPRELADGEGTG